MSVTYLKKATKTPATGTEETRKIVSDMLAAIEKGGEAEALRYGRELDGYEGEAIISADHIANAGKMVSETLKEDIQFAYDRVTRFAHAQRESVSSFETELSPGLWAGQKLIPIDSRMLCAGRALCPCGIGYHVDCDRQSGRRG